VVAGVEERAEERDPETADGNVPELESPQGTARPGYVVSGFSRTLRCPTAVI
jgi:hypothetical protein